MTTETATRFLGHCQICEGEFKLHDSKMVHHGYRRPGDGYIVGDCFGVGHVPYETSSELVKVYLGLVQVDLANVEAVLAELQDGTTKRFFQADYRQNLIEYVLGVTHPYHWENAVKQKVWNYEAEIRRLKRDVARLTKRIADWQPMPIRTVEEGVAEKRAVVEAAKAVRMAARQERLKKETEKKARQAALAARRDAFKVETKASFEKLAARKAAGEHVEKEADKLARQVRREKWLYVRDLECDEALLALGLARMEPMGDRTYCRYGYQFR